MLSVSLRSAVSLMDLITALIPWAYCSSQESIIDTDEYHDIQCNIEVQEQPWTPDILPYLQEKLGSRMMSDRSSMGKESSALASGPGCRSRHAGESQLLQSFAQALGQRIRQPVAGRLL